MEKEVLRVLQYFSFFNYPPTFEEIYTFLAKKCSQEKLKKELERLIKKKKLLTFNFKLLNAPRYTVGEYGMYEIKSLKSKVKNYKEKLRASQQKLKSWRFRVYLKLLSFFPQIRLIGLSGSIAMINAAENDDIDLFIITAKNRLFTGRFIALFLAELLGLRRRRDVTRYPLPVTHFKNKVCLNLFFDERTLEAPNFKKTEYVAHEILQMKPIINKDQTYERFLYANRWVLKFFPNAKVLNSKFKIQNSKSQCKIQNFKFLTIIFNFGFLIFNFIEGILKRFQLYFINRHRTSEIIIDHQLWFHPEDFGEKIPGIMRIKNR